MNSPIVIIGCGKSKLPGTWEAHLKYTGGYFRVKLKWALSVTPLENVYIYSAKFDIIHSSTLVPDYDVSFKNEDDQAEWVSKDIVTEQLAKFAGSKVYLLAGSDYKKTLPADFEYIDPLPKRKFGYQMQFLLNNLGKV